MIPCDFGISFLVATQKTTVQSSFDCTVVQTWIGSIIPFTFLVY